MSPQSPKVLSRRANGAGSASAGQANESVKSKGSHEGKSSNKTRRGRGSSAKSSEPSKNATEGDAPKPAKPKPQNEGEKLVVRRLPPGMTQPEFISILGNEWEAGKGKVDWFSFAPGKISQDPSKPSRPGRAYIHLMKKDDIMTLSEVVRTATWEDAKATFTSPALIGPPAVEFAIYKKVPSNKKRTDARQGTIDQDPEFMAFLEDLANPAPLKDATDADEAEDAAKAEVKVTTTPLIEYLKEKKASKAKEAASSKASKGESRGKGKGASKDDESAKKKGKESKTDKAPKETVKILTKKAASEQPAAAAKNTATQAKESSAAEAAPKSRRAGIAAAARILQRDLGLSPGSAHRKARQDAAKSDTSTKAASTKESNTSATATERPASPAKPSDAPAPAPASKNRNAKEPASKAQASNRRNRGGKVSEKGKATETTPATPPVVLLKKGDNIEMASPSTPAPPAQAPTQTSTSKAASGSSGGTKAASNNNNNNSKSQKKAPLVTPDATRGFVKHANPSQGVTEALLKQSLEIFGTITFVEIDKRKGFAYVDFAEHEGLVKAVSASPITVAQGTVQVLERKEKKAAATPATPAAGSPAPNTAEKPSGRGRRGRGGGGKGNTSNTNTNQAATPAASNGG
ncbi:Smg-4/UPF3 family-domain-containing protein [Mariannaea sp. PMI_226]|nr:Smg-4/UPF3 family-domain-containing protein [Mariannaea sp. PMI_226]